jgi:hypothetical protein
MFPSTVMDPGIVILDPRILSGSTTFPIVTGLGALVDTSVANVTSTPDPPNSILNMLFI